MKSFLQTNSTPWLCVKLGVLAIAMFGFAVFVMPPLYNLFCEVTGLNGKTDGPYSSISEQSVDDSRYIKIQFLAANNENMPWEFRPTVNTLRVHPGEPTMIQYFARNTTGKNMTAQAVPSVVPFKAAQYFHKTECFCFNQQPLDAGQSAELGLSFIVDQDLPKQFKTITLSYTLFDVTEKAEEANNDVDLTSITSQELALSSVN
ncbi:MAG: cytochrome c oxidase assembly protein subunit 11 [Cellvibrionaceae bacterium]|jgi:cytochrome c oxidase assembly protein subunit 11